MPSASEKQAILADYPRLTDQQAWENFYLLPYPPTILKDHDHYSQTRDRLYAEGKRFRVAGEGPE